MTDNIEFPKDFLWGVATSAYQIEGCTLADGAGPNIWHRFAHVPGMTVAGATGDIACDHYNRYADDVELMSKLGLQAYRFSLAWARLLPKGRGRMNPKGLGFYDRLIDLLLERDICPFVTLYHWDLPLALEDKGGWLNDDTARWFGDYADLAYRAFCDRVPYWTTINEPAVIMEKGYVLGVYAPGHRNAAEAPVVARNLLRAHGYAVQAYRDRGDGCIGIAVNIQPKHPATDSPGDKMAAGRANAWRNLQFLDAILLGRTPDELPDMFGRDWKELTEEDFRLIHQPIDYVGVNYYTRGRTSGPHSRQYRRASTSAGSSPGRCWTTSSGTPDTPCRSASCRLISRPRRGASSRVGASCLKSHARMVLTSFVTS
jgi:beta-glucosidase